MRLVSQIESNDTDEHGRDVEGNARYRSPVLSADFLG